MDRTKLWIAILGLLFLISFAAMQASAQSQVPPPPDQQPQQPQIQNGQPVQPGQQPANAQQAPQGVARVSLLRGDVSAQRGDSGDWVAVTLNTPVMAGDKISTSDNGSGEIQLDFANSLRLSGRTEANIAALESNYLQVQLAQGLIEYTVFKGAEGNSEIDTPNMAVHPDGEGSFRVQVTSPTETIVIVRRGQADISTPQGSTKISAGQMITVRGTATDAQFQTADAPAKDEWDTWNEKRDRTVEGAQSWNHVNPYYTGANDLDNHGEWSEVPDYGQVWTPNVDPDWAPYTDGNWVYEPYYGWTWVSYEPWGWAPYHYGRWFRYSGRWSWWPGPVYAGYRPLWAPAYVSFFGYGAGRFGVGLGFGFGFGSIGWLPIGPCDPFFPWFGFGARFGFFGFGDYGRFGFGVDFARRFPGAYGPLSGRFDARFSNFSQAGRDPAILRGATSVRAEDFGHGAVAHTRGISSAEFSSAHAMSGSVPATATRASFSTTNRAANPSTIRTNGNASFFGTARTQTSFRGNNGAGFGRTGQGSAGASGFQRFNGNGAGKNTRPDGNGFGSGTQPNRTFQSQGAARTDRPPQNSGANSGNAPARPQYSQPPSGAQSGAQSGGWQRFNGPSGSTAAPTQPRYQGGPQSGSNSGNAQTNNSRPPLNMSRPIVNNRTPSSSGTSRGSSGSSGRSSSGGSSGSSRGSSGGSHGSSGGHHR
jgi:hypothetical protein